MSTLIIPLLLLFGEIIIINFFRVNIINCVRLILQCFLSSFVCLFLDFYSWNVVIQVVVLFMVVFLFDSFYGGVFAEIGLWIPLFHSHYIFFMFLLLLPNSEFNLLQLFRDLFIVILFVDLLHWMNRHCSIITLLYVSVDWPTTNRAWI